VSPSPTLSVDGGSGNAERAAWLRAQGEATTAGTGRGPAATRSWPACALRRPADSHEGRRPAGDRTFLAANNGGNQKAEAGFRWILAVDAYEHGPDVAYRRRSSVGLDYSRVEPWMTAMLSARIQAATSAVRPIVVRVDSGSGTASARRASRGCAGGRVALRPSRRPARLGSCPRAERQRTLTTPQPE
jgi:hypothetical protein